MGKIIRIVADSANWQSVILDDRNNVPAFFYAGDEVRLDIGIFVDGALKADLASMTATITETDGTSTHISVPVTLDSGITIAEWRAGTEQCGTVTIAGALTTLTPGPYRLTLKGVEASSGDVVTFASGEILVLSNVASTVSQWPAREVGMPTDENLVFWGSADYGLAYHSSNAPPQTDKRIKGWESRTGGDTSFWYYDAAGTPTVNEVTTLGRTLKFNLTVGQLLATGLPALAQPFTIMGVTHEATTIVGASTYTVLSGGGMTIWMDGYSKGMMINAGTNLRGGSGAGPLVNNKNYVWSAKFNGASSKIKINRNEFVVTGNAGTASVAAGTALNLGNFFLNIQIAELLIFKSSPTDTDLAAFETYLAGKYGITLT